MTIIIKKGDSKEKNQKKINLLQKEGLNKKSFTRFCGALKEVFKEDAVAIQRKLRNEWQ